MSDKESLDSIEENVLDEETGIIMKLIQKETLSQFLTTYGDCLTDDDMKDFFAEFDTGKLPVVIKVNTLLKILSFKCYKFLTIEIISI